MKFYLIFGKNTRFSTVPSAKNIIEQDNMQKAYSQLVLKFQVHVFCPVAARGCFLYRCYRGVGRMSPHPTPPL